MSAAGLDVGLPRRLPATATYVGEVDCGHLVFYLGETADDEWGPNGRPMFRCVRCGGFYAGSTDVECRGHHPHETAQEADDRLAAVLCGRTAAEVTAYRRVWGTAPPLIPALGGEADRVAC